MTIGRRSLRAAWALVCVLGLAAGSRADETSTLIAQGKDAVAMGKFKEAERLFRKAADLAPGEPEALYGAGYAAMQQGKTKTAMDDFTAVLKATYTRRELKEFHLLAMTRIGELLVSQRRFAEALDVYKQAVVDEPANADLQYGYGVALRGRGQNEAALKRFEEALKLNPAHSGSLVGKASIYYELGNVPEAFNLLQQAIAAAPRNALPFGVMSAFYREMKKPYEERLALGQYYFYIADYRRSQNQFRGALAIKETGEAHHLLGAALLQAGNPRDAEEHFRLALKAGLKPEDVGLAQLSHTLALQGKLDEARKTIARAIKLNAKVPTYFSQQAWICLLQGDDQEAERAARKSLELDPDLAAGFRYLGDVYNKRGLAHDAIDNYEKALARDATLSDVYVNLGWAYEQAGDTVSARRNYEQFLRTSPDADTAEKVRQQIRTLDKKPSARP